MTAIFMRKPVQQLISPALHSLRNCGHLRTMAKCGPVESLIKNKLNEALQPSHIEIINESFMHNVPPGSETHFKVLVVSEAFDGLPLIKRHRLVNTTLDEELKTGVHALSIVAKTPTQWSENPQQMESSPACRGGFGK